MTHASQVTNAKKATASTKADSAHGVLQAPAVPVLGNQALLRLQRKCDCGAPEGDCGCALGNDKKKKQGHDQSPRTGLHRKPAASGAMPTPAGSSAYPEIQIGAVDDPLEREADQVADRVLSGASSSTRSLRRKESSSASAPGGSTSSGGTNVGVAPPAVHAVLSSSGGRLDASTRSFFESRFGRDLSHVRIHTGQQAEASARSVGARAYTVGNNIVFGSGEYAPSSDAGRRLVAHELAHVVQQQQMSLPPLRRACKDAGQCATPFPGDPGVFGKKMEKEGEDNIKKSDPGAAPGEEKCTKPHHRERAVNITAVTEGEGVVAPPSVSGIFINACFPANAGAAMVKCKEFPGGTPDGADPEKRCVEVKLETEEAAKAISGPDKSQWGSERATKMAAGIAHEFQHVNFDAKADKVVPAGTATDCNLQTIVGDTDHDVEHYLSEMSAEMASFPPYYQRQQTSPSPRNSDLLFERERTLAFHPNESISGIIQGLQCQCECGTVDTFIGKVFNDAVAGWPADQTDEFKKAMTRMMPAIWPAALQAK